MYCLTCSPTDSHLLAGGDSRLDRGQALVHFGARPLEENIDNDEQVQERNVVGCIELRDSR